MFHSHINDIFWGHKFLIFASSIEHWIWMSYAFVIYFTLHTLEFTQNSLYYIWQYVCLKCLKVYIYSSQTGSNRIYIFTKLNTSFIIIHKSNECKTWSQKCVEAELLFNFIFFLVKITSTEWIQFQFPKWSQCPMPDARCPMVQWIYVVV